MRDDEDSILERIFMFVFWLFLVFLLFVVFLHFIYDCGITAYEERRRNN